MPTKPETQPRGKAYGLVNCKTIVFSNSAKAEIGRGGDGGKLGSPKSCSRASARPWDGALVRRGGWLGGHYHDTVQACRSNSTLPPVAIASRERVTVSANWAGYEAGLGV